MKLKKLNKKTSIYVNRTLSRAGVWKIFGVKMKSIGFDGIIFNRILGIEVPEKLIWGIELNDAFDFQLEFNEYFLSTYYFERN